MLIATITAILLLMGGGAFSLDAFNKYAKENVDDKRRVEQIHRRGRRLRLRLDRQSRLPALPGPAKPLKRPFISGIKAQHPLKIINAFLRRRCYKCQPKHGGDTGGVLL